jgi:hypothetical protein
MAQSVLKVHHTLSGKYEPYGYYANYQEDDFALPFHDSNHINAFLDVVPLRRMSGQAGLSVAIPFPSSELADKGPIVKAVVKEFFHPIIHGHLEVTIDYPGSDEIKITSETIKQYAYQFFGNDEALLESVELTLRSVCVNEENVLSLAINENRWRDVVLSTEQLEEMGVRLETDHFLALQVPAVVTHGGIEAKTFFSLYVSRCDSKFRSTCKYIREGIDVKDANNEKLDAGISALLEVHDGVLGGLLNRAENPAHTKWVIRGSGDRLHDYQEWRSVIAFVRNAPHEILKLILNRELEKHKDILSDIFYVEEDSDKPASIPTPRPPPKPTDDPPIAPDITDDKKKTKLIFTKKTGSSSGFSIKKNAAFSGSISKLTVKVAYRVSKGSPLKKYRSFDFCLDKKPIRVNADGFMNELYKSNVFVADVVSQKFILEIDGFDRQRDLYVYFDASVESVDDSET